MKILTRDIFDTITISSLNLENVVFQSAKRVCMGNYITSCSLFTKDELCNEVLNTNAKHECLMPLHKESWVKNEQRVI